MATSHLHPFNPYQRFVFWPLWVLSVILTAVISGILYYFLAQNLLQQTRAELEGIAVKTAGFIPTSIHENLQEPADQKSADYKLLELYLQSIMSGNPQIDDIYTLRPTDDPGTMTFVISGAETADHDTDGVIDEEEQKAMLGEQYDIFQAPKIKEGLAGPASDEAVTYDKWGGLVIRLCATHK